MSSKVGLGKCDGEGGIGREIELCITLSPVSKTSQRAVREKYWVGPGEGANLMTAMLTGAVVLARYICLSDPMEAIVRDIQMWVVKSKKNLAHLSFT